VADLATLEGHSSERHPFQTLSADPKHNASWPPWRNCRRTRWLSVRRSLTARQPVHATHELASPLSDNAYEETRNRSSALLSKSNRPAATPEPLGRKPGIRPLAGHPPPDARRRAEQWQPRREKWRPHWCLVHRNSTNRLPHSKPISPELGSRSTKGGAARECRTRRKMHGLLLHAGSRLAKCFMLDG